MQGIATTIRLVDQMTAPIMSINNAINNLIGGFSNVENASDINTASLDEMRNQVNALNAYVEQLNQTYSLVGDTINQMTKEQTGFNESVRQGGSAADGLIKKIGSAVAAYASFQGIKKVLDLSDEMTSTTARLNIMNDGLQTTQELQDKIFLSAERSRGVYSNTAQTVSKLGLLAVKAFSSNDEIIAFTELMNKNFVIGGASIQEQTSAMYQLTQAMAAGKLQGDEYRSIIENAPLLANAIESYMTGAGVEGTMKEWAADGLLTADVIKSALFSVADETNSRFEQMPMTFGQIATSIKNQALMQFQPILNKLNEIANSSTFQSLADNIINTLIVVSGVILGIFDIIGAIGQFAIDNWGWLAPIIYTVVAAMTAYTVILGIYNTIQAISNGLSSLAAARSAIKAGATIAEAAATKLATGAQVGLNTALLACPLTWIIIAIIAIIGAIYLVIGIINKCAGTSISATGIIFGAFAWLGSVVANIFMGLLDLIFGIINALVNPFIKIANFIGNIFTNPISSIIYLFQGMADGVLAILQKIASALDFVFGSNMADTVAGWRDGLKDMADAAVAKYAPNENYQNVIDELDLSVEKTLGWKRFDNTDAFNAGYAVGEAVADFDPASLLQINIPDGTAYGAYDYSGIESGISNIDANTKGQLDYSEEELKFWRDIAERETINRFTTAEVTVEFGDVNNNVSSEMDLDGIVSYISEHVEDALLNVAEGVHV